MRQILLLLALLGLWAPCVLALQDIKFVDLDPAASHQIILFFKGGEEASVAALESVEKAEATVKASGLELAQNLTFYKCDGGVAENAKLMMKKGISLFPMLFVSVQGQGLDRYMRDMAAEPVAEYIQAKLEPQTEDDIFPYNPELIDDSYPTLVMFMEAWCSRCKYLKHAFQKAATETVGRVMFMEVECSSTEETKKFCGRHQIDGYPTMTLMGGSLKKRTVEYKGERSYQGIMEFLKKEVPDAFEGLEEETVS